MRDFDDSQLREIWLNALDGKLPGADLIAELVHEYMYISEEHERELELVREKLENCEEEKEELEDKISDLRSEVKSLRK